MVKHLVVVVFIQGWSLACDYVVLQKKMQTIFAVDTVSGAALMTHAVPRRASGIGTLLSSSP